MAIEAKRGCGYRKVGGLYLVAGGVWAECDRLPMPIGACPVCGMGMKFSRGLAKIDALHLLGLHCHNVDLCKCDLTCVCCFPPEKPSFLLGVGERFYPTPQDFVAEGIRQGVSKRLHQIPKNFKLGESWIYLTHKKAICVRTPCTDTAGSPQATGENTHELLKNSENQQPELLNQDKLEKVEYRVGIFSAFRPERIEKLIWQSEAIEDNIKALEKRGITPVVIPDGDTDHMK